MRWKQSSMPVLFLMSVCTLSQNILKRVPLVGVQPLSWEHLSLVALSEADGGTPAGRWRDTSTQTAAVMIIVIMIMIIVCHDHCDGGGCCALQS